MLLVTYAVDVETLAEEDVDVVMVLPVVLDREEVVLAEEDIDVLVVLL